jgi:hypothetical protein
MKNYGEVLAYWYFRLNGFIAMDDFVLHGDSGHRGSDCDLVAVRFPHVWEKVGGQENDWDHTLLRNIGHDGQKTLAVFVQVKTGKDAANRPRDIDEYFAGHLEYLTRRLGFWEREHASHVANAFRSKAVLSEGIFVLSKVVILPDMRERRKECPWIELRLDDVVQFIYHRMQKYMFDKGRDRMNFPDPMIQFFADQAANAKYRWANEECEPHDGVKPF